MVLDSAVKKLRGDERKLVWKELLAGGKAFKETGDYKPQATLDALSAPNAFKGPLATPRGGFRILNVNPAPGAGPLRLHRPSSIQGHRFPVKRRIS